MSLTRFVRLIQRSPGFFAAAVLTLALGIGANTAVFSVLYNILLRPLPYSEPDRLVVITGGARNVTSRMPVAPADYNDWQTRSGSFEEMSAAELWQANLTTAEGAEPLRGMRVSANLFDVLGVAPASGGNFTREDDVSERRVAIISDALWRRRFGSDREIVGRTVRLNGEPYTILGVMPASFHFAPFWAPRMEIWTPIAFTPERRSDRGGQSLRVFGRLKPGVGIRTAAAEIETIAAAIAREHPEIRQQRTARVESLMDVAVGDTRPMLWMLLGAVGLVLLLACVNVANLLLARAATRHREMAVRHAIGGARSAIVRQLLAENLWLAACGGVGGVLLGRWTLDLMLAQLPEDILPRQMELGFQVESLVFAACVTLITIFAFGLVPALYQSASPAIEALRGGRGLSASASQKRIMRWGLAGQIALAIILLTGAGLLLRSFSRLLSIDPGFDSAHLVVAPVSTTGAEIRKAEFYEQLHRRLNAIPGVESASVVNHAPVAGDEWGVQVLTEEQSEEPLRAVYRVAMPGYFRTMRIPLISGRDLNFDDRHDKPAVAVVNQAFARRHYGGDAAVGKRFRRSADASWTTIVGVVGDVKQQTWTAPVEPEIYFAFLQESDYVERNSPMFGMTAVVRGTGPVAESIREQVRALNSAVALSRVQTMEDAISHAVARPRLALMLLGWFAAIALLLAAVGIYGTASFLVNERHREIGIRIAVGAEPGQIRRMLGLDAARLIGAGVVCGLIAAAALSSGIQSMLYQVNASDAVTYAVVGLAVAMICAAAAMIPARRASRIDPLVALREE